MTSRRSALPTDGFTDRTAHGCADEAADTPTAHDPVARLSYPRRLGEAFCQLLEALDAKRLPVHGGDATTVIVTIPFEKLMADLGAADLLGSGTVPSDPHVDPCAGETITASQARRLACNARIIPAVLGSDSEVLDLGRAQRLFSASQRRALLLRDRTCRADGCDIPGTWSEAHHWVAWRSVATRISTTASCSARTTTTGPTTPTTSSNGWATGTCGSVGGHRPTGTAPPEPSAPRCPRLSRGRSPLPRGEAAMASGRGTTRTRGALVRVLAAWGLFSAGHWMLMLALAVYAYDQAGAAGVGAVTVARLFPAMLAAPPSGAAVDRLDRGRIVLVSVVAQAVLSAAVLAIVVSDAPFTWVVVVVVLLSATGAPVRPALQAILPGLAHTPAALTRATAAWSGVDSAGFLVGAGVGGVLLGVSSMQVVLTAALVTAVLTTLLVARLPPSRALSRLPERGQDDAPGALAGLRDLLSTPGLRSTHAVFAGATLLEGATDVLFVPLAIDELGLGDGGVGLLYTVWGVGGLLGSAALLVMLRRTGYGTVLLVGGGLFAVLVVVTGVGGALVVLLAMLPVGVAYTLLESGIMGVVPRLVDDGVIGRVYAVREVLHAGVAALGAAIAPVLILLFGVRVSLMIIGAGYGLLVLALAVSLLRLDRGERVVGRVRDLLHDIEFLRPLPLPHLERLVRSATPVRVAAGDTVITEGETGDTFYAVERGEVEIVGYDRIQGPGSGFGEVALLLDVPRTATVRARVDSELWTVGRSPFLGAVGVTDEAGLVARRTVEAHLARERIESPPDPGHGEH